MLKEQCDGCGVDRISLPWQLNNSARVTLRPGLTHYAQIWRGLLYRPYSEIGQGARRPPTR